ncbi:hypothetical protein DRA43_25860 [Micromonospora provocatoris]|nr:hypothetical protein [Micromonospora provocatoris]RBI98633.1 hypothetical protein DRA43_25860 [Micromonospora provocatoris]
MRGLGGGGGEVRLWQHHDVLTCQVSDNGPGLGEIASRCRRLMVSERRQGVTHQLTGHSPGPVCGDQAIMAGKQARMARPATQRLSRRHSAAEEWYV